MIARMTSLVVALVAPAAAFAGDFCQIVDQSAVLDRIAGEWTRDGAISAVNATMDVVNPSAQYPTRIASTGLVENTFFDDLLRGPSAVILADPRPYDVDGVDDLLDTTGRSDLADILSDIPCGPDQLPQLVTKINLPIQPRTNLANAPDLGIEGTVTYIAYFDDRLLELTELTVKSDEAVLFLTETALLRPESTNKE